MLRKNLKTFLSLVIAVTTFFGTTSSCKARKSDLKGIDPSLTGLLNLSTVSDPAALTALCFQDSFVLFVGNAETLGQVVANPHATETFRPEYLKQLQINDRAKEEWYFNKIKHEYAALLQKLSADDPACKGSNINTKVTLLAILDGPSVGDSIVEVSTFKRGPQGTRDAKTQGMYFDVKAKTLRSRNAGQSLELLMPRDVPLIMSALRDTTRGMDPYWFGVKIIKGHGVTVHSGGDFGLKDALQSLLELGSNVYPVTMLDSQDENGFITSSSSQNFYKIPMWTPETLCREMYGPPESAPYKACLRDTITRLNQGFQVANMASGCGSSSLGRLAQGDTKQGDTKQGDTKQGDTKQGDTKQGDTKQGDTKQGDTKQGDTKQGAALFLQDLSGMDFGPNSRQGGKGFAAPAHIADGRNLGGRGPEPAAFRIIGLGRSLGDWFIKGVELDLPIQSHYELVILDSCNMDGHHAMPYNWLRNTPNRLDPSSATTRYSEEEPGNTDLVLLMNPFPVAADAVEYGALNLQQYYFLTASMIENTPRIHPKASSPLRSYLKKKPEIERIAKLKQQMNSVAHKKFIDPEDIYCSLYSERYACISKFCEPVRDNRDWIDDVHRFSAAFRAIGVIDALLVELQDGRDLPKAMIDHLQDNLFSSINFSYPFLESIAFQRRMDYLIENDVVHPKTPLMKQVLTLYLELLRKMVQAESLETLVKMDPMRLNFLISGLGMAPIGPPTADYQRFHQFAVEQNATSESFDAYRARHDAAWSKVSALAQDYFAAQKNAPRSEIDPKFETLMQAFLAAAQDR